MRAVRAVRLQTVYFSWKLIVLFRCSRPQSWLPFWLQSWSNTTRSSSPSQPPAQQASISHWTGADNTGHQTGSSWRAETEEQGGQSAGLHLHHWTVQAEVDHPVTVVIISQICQQTGTSQPPARELLTRVMFWGPGIVASTLPGQGKSSGKNDCHLMFNEVSLR